MPKNLSLHFICVFFLFGLVLSGCGQKGPLYLERQDKTTDKTTDKSAIASPKSQATQITANEENK